MSSTIDIIKSFTSTLVIDRIKNNPAPMNEPAIKGFSAAVIFADITGFTKLTKKLTENNPRGVEELAGILNIYIGKIVDIITENGGDVVKFAGDAVFAIWKVEKDSTLPIETHRAVKCGNIIQNKLHNLKMDSGVTMALKVGVGAGKLYALHVGGIFERWELVMAGHPMRQVATAGNLSKSGQVVVSPQVVQLLQKLDAGSKKGRYFLFNNVQQTSKNAPHEVPSLKDVPERYLRSYVPRAVLDRVDEGTDIWAADMRQVTVLFINVKGLQFNTSSSVQEIQKTMKAMQRSLYFYEGSINRFGVDDKGSVLLAAFGLPPLDHVDDPLRGLLAARKVKEELLVLDKECIVGISTGVVFCGSVGNDTRCEYTFHGTNVNFAARLMQKAESVLCDEETYKHAKNDMEFEKLPPMMFKGGTEPVSVYKPLY